MPSHQPCIQFCDINGYGFFSKLTKLYVVNVCFMDDCAGGGGGGGGAGRSGKKWGRMRPCDLIEYNKLQFFKLLFVYYET